MLDFVLLIPCYNNLEGLYKSIESIEYINQRFIIIVIDDGSHIPITLDGLKMKFNNKPILVINNKINVGITTSLNNGLRYITQNIQTQYIARLDCGDLCSKDRFMKQVDYLNANHDIHLLGSWCKFIDHKKQSSYLYQTKTNHQDILKEMNFKCSFIHPTVMFRVIVLSTIGMYPTNYSLTEDYAYFWEILNKHQCSILPEILTTIELNSNSLSSKNYKKQLLQRIKIINKFSNHVLYKCLGILTLSFRYILPTKLVLMIKYLK